MADEFASATPADTTSWPTTCAEPANHHVRQTDPDIGFAQLVSDIGAVIDSLGVGQVHLLAHDWGSIQAWAAVTDESVMGKIASFTSISGPHLQYAGAFLRSARTPRTAAQVAGQLVSSGYIGFFLCPGVPELAFRSRLLVKVVEAS